MKRAPGVAVVIVLALVAGRVSAGPIIDGREWYQPVELVGYSWNDFYAVCAAGPCNGLLGGAGPNLTGWTWASIYEVGDLFAANSPHAGGISFYQSPQLQPFIDFISDTGFVRTTDDMLAINTGLTGIAAFSSTLVPDAELAYLGVAQLSVGFPAGTPFGSIFSTTPVSTRTEAGPYVGGWLYRAAEVPVPATLWLLTMGVLALRWSRYRTA